jgi:PPOX class probable F420-dependent enzyme
VPASPAVEEGPRLSGTWRRRVSGARVARLVTVTAEGRPHAVPCCFILVAGETGDVVYSAVDAKPKRPGELRRVANVRRQPWASLLVDRYREDWTALWWVRLDGPVRVLVDGPEAERAVAGLRRKYAQYRAMPLLGPDRPVLALDVAAERRWAAALA